MSKKDTFGQPIKKAKKLKTFTPKQIFWFVLGILISANALVFLVLGLINDYAPLAYSPFEAANSGMISALFGLDFKWFGVITLILGTIIYSLALSFSAKTQEREEEREQRRKQRRSFSFNEGEKVVSTFNVSTSETSVPLPPNSNQESK